MAIIVDNDNKEVRFDVYCKTCEYEKTEETKRPCNECLEEAMREGTYVPLRYKSK